MPLQPSVRSLIRRKVLPPQQLMLSCWWRTRSSSAFQKAVHLRTAGFDVIEAADGEEARRVLDSVPVNVVFADLAMPDQTNALAFLRWLRKHHPAIKTIVTSGTKTDMPLDGYGIFLSRPYRVADFDYCLEKVLATASIPASETGGDTTADPSRKANPVPDKAQPGSVRPNGPPASDEADGRDDDVSTPSIAELSRRLAERAARQRAVDPAAAKAAYRAALNAHDRTRAPAEIGAGVHRGGDRLLDCRLPCPDGGHGSCPAVSKCCGAPGARVPPPDGGRHADTRRLARRRPRRHPHCRRPQQTSPTRLPSCPRPRKRQRRTANRRLLSRRRTRPLCGATKRGKSRRDCDPLASIRG
jgi:hypothetical protein